MLTVWKYEIPIEDDFYLEIPWGFKFLDLKIQNDIPVLWVAVHDTHAKRSVHFSLVGTGHEMDENFNYDNYLGTILMANDKLTWHLFCLSVN